MTNATTGAGEAYVRKITRAMEDFGREHAAERLARFRPVLAEDVGEEIAGRVLDDPGVLDFALRAVEIGAADEPDAAYAVANYLRDEPGATIERAYTAAMERIRHYAEQGDE